MAEKQKFFIEPEGKALLPLKKGGWEGFLGKPSSERYIHTNFEAWNAEVGIRNPEQTAFP